MNTSGFNITAVFIPVDYDNPVREIQIDSSNGFHSVFEALKLNSENELETEGLYGLEGPTICYNRELQFLPKRWENERATHLAGFKVYGDVVLVDVHLVSISDTANFASNSKGNTTSTNDTKKTSHSSATTSSNGEFDRSDKSNSSTCLSSARTTNSAITFRSVTINDYLTFSQKKNLLCFNFERNYLHSLKNPKLLAKQNREQKNKDSENNGRATFSSTGTEMTTTATIPQEYNPTKWRGKTPKTLLSEYQRRLGDGVLHLEYSRLNPESEGPHMSKLIVRYKDEVMEFVSSRPHNTVRDSEQDAALVFIHYVLSLRSSYSSSNIHSDTIQSSVSTETQISKSPEVFNSSVAYSTLTAHNATPDANFDICPTMAPISSQDTRKESKDVSTSCEFHSSSVVSPPSLLLSAPAEFSPSIKLPPEFNFATFQNEMKAMWHNKPFEDLLADGTLVKLKLVEGSGKQIRSRNFVKFHYAVKLRDEIICENTLSGDAASGHVGEGSLFILDVFLRTMRVGEHALFYAKYTRCYGELGCPPKIPPRSDLLYFVVILAATKITRPHEEQVPLTEEDRIYQANHHRETGNIFFRAHQYTLAYDEYKSGLRMLQPLQSEFDSLQDQYKLCVTELLSVLHSNLAATNLNFCDWDAAILHANEALKLKEYAVKPLIRRSEAYIGKCDFDRARDDLQAAERLLNSVATKPESSLTSVSLLSNDPTSLRLLLERAVQKLKLKEKQYEDESKKMCLKMFAPNTK
jgi:hypothetical protein